MRSPRPSNLGSRAPPPQLFESTEIVAEMDYSTNADSIQEHSTKCDNCPRLSVVDALRQDFIGETTADVVYMASEAHHAILTNNFVRFEAELEKMRLALRQVMLTYQEMKELIK